MAILKDSGDRANFSTGAVRDANTDKGRMDLVPLDTLADIIAYYTDHKSEFSEMITKDTAVTAVLKCWNEFQWSGNNESLIRAFIILSLCEFGDLTTATLELSQHFKDGAVKYSENNWRLGIALHRYTDSGPRHLLELWRGDTDEPHGRAALWNLMCGLWTAINFDVSNTEVHDLPYDKAKQKEISPTTQVDGQVKLDVPN